MTTFPTCSGSSLASARQARALVDLEADAVAETVAEVLALPGCARSARVRRRRARDRWPRAGRRRAPVLGPSGRARRSRVPARRSARRWRTCACSQSSSPRAGRPSRSSRARRCGSHGAGLGVRQRAVRAGGDDRGEARALGAETAHAQLQLDRDLALGAADDAGFEYVPRNASSASSGRPRGCGRSPQASLTARMRSTAPAQGTSSHPRRAARAGARAA